MKVIVNLPTFAGPLIKSRLLHPDLPQMHFCSAVDSVDMKNRIYIIYNNKESCRGQVSL